jgi:hypothetical protein
MEPKAFTLDAIAFEQEVTALSPNFTLAMNDNRLRLLRLDAYVDYQRSPKD